MNTLGTALPQSGIVSLMHTVLGAGLLSIPYAVRGNGLLLGLLLIMWSAFTSALGLYFLAYASKFAPAGHASFFCLSSKTVPQLSLFFDLAIAVKCLGVSCSYLIVIGDLAPQVINSVFSEASIKYPWIANRSIWIAVFVFLVSPLAYQRHLHSLKNASMVALSSVIYLLILVVAHFVYLHIFHGHEKINPGPVSYFKPSSFTEILTSLPIFIFGFTCHQNQFTIINELQDRSTKTTTYMIKIAISFSCIIYLIIGTTGYLTFGDKTVSNIIKMYPSTWPTTIGRVAIIVLVSLSYPLQCHPARNSINHVIYRLRKGQSTNTTGASSPLLTDDLEDDQFSDVDSEEEELEGHVIELEDSYLIIITTSIIVFTLAIATNVTSLGKVLAVVGATGSTSISFILPGIFVYKLTLDPRIKIASGLLVFWGIIVMAVSLTATIFFGATKH